MQKLDLDLEEKDCSLRIDNEEADELAMFRIVEDGEAASVLVNVSEARAIRNWLTRFIEENES